MEPEEPSLQIRSNQLVATIRMHWCLPGVGLPLRGPLPSVLAVALVQVIVPGQAPDVPIVSAREPGRSPDLARQSAKLCRSGSSVLTCLHCALAERQKAVGLVDFSQDTS